jgi:5,10-methylenetetrahydromethanopterin reductase
MRYARSQRQRGKGLEKGETMHIGLMSGARQEMDDFDALIRMVSQAEQDGLSHVWFAHRANLGYDALTTIALVGRQTSRITLGTAVVPTFPYHPLELAHHALTAQAATKGRLVLGIGLSHRPMVENVLGLSYDHPARHMQEYLSVLRPLVNDGRVEFSGRVFRVMAELRVTGASPCPVLIAALAPRMLRLAGGLADGTITWMAGRKTIESHIVPRMSDAAKAAGRPQPRVCVALPVAVCDDPAQGREQAAKEFQRYNQLVNYRRVLDLEGVDGPADVVVVGDEAQVEHQLRAFAAAGTTDFLAAIFPVGADPAASIARTWALLKNLNGKL